MGHILNCLIEGSKKQGPLDKAIVNPAVGKKGCFLYRHDSKHDLNMSKKTAEVFVEWTNDYQHYLAMRYGSSVELRLLNNGDKIKIRVISEIRAKTKKS